MSTTKRAFSCCVLLPILLVGGCFGKMEFDRVRYNLPGEILKSPAQPTRKLDSAMQVAETLDSYVQPRFEILRDRNFGAIRIVYRKHAGIVQLKVDTPQEKELIANVNATHRDYAIGLLHCAPKPDREFHGNPKLEMLYLNQQQVASNWDGMYFASKESDMAAKNQINWAEIQEKAIATLAGLKVGKEHRTQSENWAVLMRPVPAKQECLSCHTNAKLGAALGVMIYAVRNTKSSTPKSQKVGLR